MSIFLSDPAFSVRYVLEEPYSCICSLLAFALALPVSDGTCSLQISVEACDFLFSQSMTMLVRFETDHPQLFLGQDWFLLFQDVMAGHSVAIGLERIYFPVRSMPPPALWSSQIWMSSILRNSIHHCMILYHPTQVTLFKFHGDARNMLHHCLLHKHIL